MGRVRLGPPGQLQPHHHDKAPFADAGGRPPARDDETEPEEEQDEHWWVRQRPRGHQQFPDCFVGVFTQEVERGDATIVG